MNTEMQVVAIEGVAGGIATLWHRNLFTVVSVTKCSRYILLEVLFPDSAQRCYIGNIYGPNDEASKREFFNSLSLAVQNRAGPLILGGDFNSTLNDGERRSNNNSRIAYSIFKNFVELHDLIDLPQMGTSRGIAQGMVDFGVNWIGGYLMMNPLSISMGHLKVWKIGESRIIESYALHWGPRILALSHFVFITIGYLRKGSRIW